MYSVGDLDCVASSRDSYGVVGALLSISGFWDARRGR